MLGVQGGVKAPHLGVVVRQGGQGVARPRQRDGLAGGVPLGGPLAQVAVGRREPRRPRREVAERRGGYEGDEVGHAAAHDARAEPQPHTGGAAGLGVGHEGEDPEGGHGVDAGPLDAAAQAQHDAGGHQPPAHAQARAPGVGRAPGALALRVAGGVGDVGGDAARQARAGPALVLENEDEPGEDERGQEHVEQAGAGEHEVRAVDGEEEPGQRAQQGGAQQAGDEQPHEQHAERPGHGRGDAPAEPVVGAADELPEGQQPLAQRRVDDVVGGGREPGQVPGDEAGVVVVGPLALVAEFEEGGSLLDVEGLVEDQGVRVAQVDHAQDEGEDRREHRPQPRPQAHLGAE